MAATTELVYAGVGSRRTPLYVQDLMRETARRLALRGWTLRTGGAEGADTAWMDGCLLAEPDRYELFLPFPGFSKQAPATLERPSEGAYDVSARYHPAWERCNTSAQLLHARNAHIVLGRELDAPVRMLLCWTSDGGLDGRGRYAGGTGQALRIAAGEAPGCTVLNLKREKDRARLEAFVS